MNKTIYYDSLLLKANPQFQCVCTGISYQLIRGTSNASCYCYVNKTAMLVSCIWKIKHIEKANDSVNWK